MGRVVAPREGGVRWEARGKRGGGGDVPACGGGWNCLASRILHTLCIYIILHPDSPIKIMKKGTCLPHNLRTGAESASAYS